MVLSSAIVCDRLRSRSQDRRRSQTIAEVCFHMIADDRRTFCDLRSAIRDRLRSYGNQPLEDISGGKLGTDDWHRVTKGKIRIFVFSFFAGLTVCGQSSLFFLRGNSTQLCN